MHPAQLELFGHSSTAAPLPPVSAPTSAEARSELRARFSERQETLANARLLAQRIADGLGTQLRVILTVHDNRSTMISFRRHPPLLRLRLHHMFLDAPDSVVRAIIEYAGQGRRSAGTALDAFIAARQERIRSTPHARQELVARGTCFDLELIFARLNELYFQGGIRARIGWGRRTGGRRKSIRLGVYDHKAREIRVHPALDKPDVPLFFVEFIVFHEMLHQLFPSDRDRGRHVHHPRAFRDRERVFPKYQAAITWEKEHLRQLLRR